MSENRPPPDHAKDDHTPRELAALANLHRHVLFMHRLGGISDVWTFADLRAFHDDLHAPPRRTSAYLDAMDHDRGYGG